MSQIMFHPEVQKDVIISYQWYEEQSTGLGEDFLAELKTSYQTIEEFPDSWPIFKTGFRKFLLSRFPFSIIYRKSHSKIFIVAVMHQNRKPTYWLNRS